MKPGASRASLLLVYVTVFIDMVGFGVVVPLLPFEVTSRAEGGMWYGLILSAFSTAQFFGAALLGRLSDRFGRKPVLLVSLAGTAAGMALLGRAPTLGLMLASRLFAGLFAGSISTAQAYVADVTVPAERARYMGWVGSCIGLGFVLGPAIGGMMAKYGFRAACDTAAAMSLAAFVFGLFALRESNVHRHAAKRTWNPAEVWRTMRRPKVGAIIGAGFLTSFAFVAMQSTIPLIGSRNVGMTEKNLAAVMTMIGAIIVLIQGGAVGRLAPIFGERRLATAGCVGMALALAAIPFMPTMAFMMGVLAVFATGNALIRPTIASLLSLEASVGEQGGVLGLGQSLQAAARAIGPVLYGWMYDLDFRSPYLLGTFCAAMAFGLLLLTHPAAKPPLDAGFVREIDTIG